MKVVKYAAIDVGSNAIRMLIANVITFNNKTFIQKNSLVRLPVRLGHDSFTKGFISELNITNLINAFKAFQLLMNIHNVKEFRVYGTSALREAKNKIEVVDRIYKKTKIRIQIIDGIKEAEVISKTNFFDLVGFYKTLLYVDVGGGSTELTIIANSKKVMSKSFKLGTVRIISGNEKIKEWKLMKEWIEKNLKKYLKIYLLGTGGNINKLHKLTNTKEGKPITYLILKSLYQKLSVMTYEERIVNFGLNLDRSDVIIPAMKIYLKSLEWSGSKVIYVPQAGLTDGMIREIVNE